ncbi:hypothetical protein N5E15_22270 [Pantoea stewartii]|uniref:hypothetical protein n=1 Tax=Pantoea stewartii TaxID=66269 RepID=UPI0021D491DB|nr:hypothetical protein [Pantoea stewartii]MCU7369300.1 hypothetical protein [Pantoea stewartii]
MLIDIEKFTNTVTGEALLSLIREDATVSNESLATRLQHYLQTEDDAHRRQALLAAVSMLNTFTGNHDLPDNITQSKKKVFFLSATKH